MRLPSLEQNGANAAPSTPTTDTVSYDKKETQADHYIKQLNGFLKAGIIEKNEYDLLIRRYKP